MAELEQAFGDTEKAAQAARKSAAAVVSRAGALAKAAQTGNVAAIKRGQKDLDAALETLRQEVANTRSCWPFAEAEERRLFAQDYARELRDAAAKTGLEMHERDGRLIAYPSVLRVLPAECAVRVDRKKISTVRPTYLASLLRENQGKTGRFPPQRFLECLYNVYADITNESSADMLSESAGRVVPLARIYKLMTALPGAARDYDRGDFARDLYALDMEGPRRTRSGATVSFPSSTGTKRAGDLFSFIGPDGNSVDYYGIKFAGEKR